MESFFLEHKSRYLKPCLLWAMDRERTWSTVNGRHIGHSLKTENVLTSCHSPTQKHDSVLILTERNCFHLQQNRAV